MTNEKLTDGFNSRVDIEEKITELEGSVIETIQLKYKGKKS